MINKRCAIYCRVSTLDQNPKIQEKSLLQYAKYNNYPVYKIYTDFISGSKDTRPQLDQLLQDMRKGLFKIVIVWKLDRLGRNARHLLEISEEMQNKGITLISTTQAIDTSTPTGKLVYTILGSVAELERAYLIERVKLGLKGCKTVGKRGKDKKPRKRLGYYQRYTKKTPPSENE